MKKNKTEKSLSVGKIILIIFIVFTFVPIFLLSIIYHTNDNMKLEMNKYLVLLPGSLGEHFKSYPTEEELNEQITEIASYIINIDNNRAVDKLMVIKNEDEKLYSDIIKVMLKQNPSKTKEVVESIRETVVKKDVLASVEKQIEEEKVSEISNKAELYEELSLISGRNKIVESINNGTTTYKELGQIFEVMNSDIAAELLSYLDLNYRNKILENISSDDKKAELFRLISALEDNNSKLLNIAEIYSTENPEKLIDILGNNETYKIEELATIYRNMDLIKGAQILSKVNDDDFVFELINNIKEQEILLKGEDKITDDILKALKIYRNFESNVNNLTSIYDKMNESQIADLIKRLFINSNEAQVYTLNNGQSITLNDEDLAIAVLKKFSDRKLAGILSNLDTNLSSEISKKITYPNP